MAVAPSLDAGPLLVESPRPLEVRAGDALVTIDVDGATPGAARLDRRIGLGVGTYAGRVSVASAGRSVSRARWPR